MSPQSCKSTWACTLFFQAFKETGANGEVSSLLSVSMGTAINCIIDLKTGSILTPFIFLADVAGAGPHNPWKLFLSTGVRLRGREDRFFFIMLFLLLKIRWLSSSGQQFSSYKISLSTQHSCCVKHSENAWLMYAQRHGQETYKRKKVT